MTFYDRESELEALESAFASPGPDTREEQFALFSKSGFVDGLRDDLDDDWLLFDRSDVDRLLSPGN